MRPLEISAHDAQKSVIELTRLGAGLCRVKAADDSILVLDAAAVKTLSDGMARLGTLQAREAAAQVRQERARASLASVGVQGETVDAGGTAGGSSSVTPEPSVDTPAAACRGVAETRRAGERAAPRRAGTAQLAMPTAAARVKAGILALGMFPLRCMHPANETDRQEDLLARRYATHKDSMPAGVLRELERVRETLSEALVQEVLAFMRANRRRPKRSSLGGEEDALARRFERAAGGLSDEQRARLAEREAEPTPVKDDIENTDARDPPTSSITMVQSAAGRRGDAAQLTMSPAAGQVEADILALGRFPLRSDARTASASYAA